MYFWILYQQFMEAAGCVVTRPFIFIWYRVTDIMIVIAFALQIVQCTPIYLYSTVYFCLSHRMKPCAVVMHLTFDNHCMQLEAVLNRNSTLNVRQSLNAADCSIVQNYTMITMYHLIRVFDYMSLISWFSWHYFDFQTENVLKWVF